MFDVWLTVHHSSMWNKKLTRRHLVLYLGQTSRNLKTCYNEHIRYIKSNNPQSAYAQHILNNRQPNDPP